MSEQSGDRILKVIEDAVEKFGKENGYAISRATSYYGGEPAPNDLNSLFTMKLDLTIAREVGVATVATRRIGYTAAEARKLQTTTLDSRMDVEFAKRMPNLFHRIDQIIKTSKGQRLRWNFEEGLSEWSHEERQELRAKVVAYLRDKGYRAEFGEGGPGNEGVYHLYVDWELKEDETV
ncbi:MAG: hypothetical protein ACREGB_00055 [Candidatus Saccharimonadales bacterium]